MEDNHLLPPPTTTSSHVAIEAASAAAFEDDDTVKLTSSNSDIMFRLLSVLIIGVIAIWANSEASKGFDLTIVNDAGDTVAGGKFDLFFVSNDKITRIVLKASGFVEKALYDPGDIHSKKVVDHVIVRLADRNLTHMVMVGHGEKNEYVVNISPSVMQGRNVDYAMASAVQRGMARIWVWDGEDSAPPALVDGVVEYLSILAGFSPAGAILDTVNLPESEDICWMKKDPVAMAELLNYCEAQNKGFIRRLNQEMKDGWQEEAFQTALGLPVKHLCASYNSTNNNFNGLFGRSMSY